jgi:hypothetical protein
MNDNIDGTWEGHFRVIAVQVFLNILIFLCINIKNKF